MNKFLISTEDLKIWPPRNSKAIFLGEWCVNNLDEGVLESFNYNYEIIKNQWRDKNILVKDFKIINKLIYRIIEKLSIYLNNYHKVDYSSQYWEILLSPWLSYLIGNVYEKLKLFENLKIENDKNLQFNTYEYDFSEFIPLDTLDYAKHYSNLDDWSQLIFNEIIQNYFNFKITINKKKIKKIKIKREDNKNLLKTVVKNLSFLNFFSLNNNLIIYQSGLGKYNTLKAYLKTFNFPLFHSEYNKIQNDINLESRDLIKINTKSNLEDFLFYIAKKYIPMCFNENFTDYVKESKKIDYSKNIKFIITSTGHYFDETFKIYAANKKENSSKLIILQHGGSYGQTLCNFNEYYDSKISDLFLTWGWNTNNNSKIKPLGYLPKKNKNIVKKNNNILLILNCSSKYTNMISGNPTGPIVKDYLLDQELFYKNLQKELKIFTYIKKYPFSYGWKSNLFHNNIYNELKFEENQYSIDIIKKYKVIVNGWNSTVYLETLYNNIPTVIFWRDNICRTNNQSFEHLKILNSVGIFHFTPESAANFLNKNINNIDEWWSDSKLQKIKNNFIEFYIKQSNCNELMKLIFKP